MSSTSEDTNADTVDTEPVPDASLASGSISLINSMLGAGMLGIPLAYAKSGLFPAIIVHLLMILVSYLTFYYLFYVSDATQTYSFGNVCIFFICFLAIFHFSILAWLCDVRNIWYFVY